MSEPVFLVPYEAVTPTTQSEYSDSAVGSDFLIVQPDAMTTLVRLSEEMLDAYEIGDIVQTVW